MGVDEDENDETGPRTFSISTPRRASEVLPTTSPTNADIDLAFRQIQVLEEKCETSIERLQHQTDCLWKALGALELEPHPVKAWPIRHGFERDWLLDETSFEAPRQDDVSFRQEEAVSQQDEDVRNIIFDLQKRLSELEVSCTRPVGNAPSLDSYRSDCMLAKTDVSVETDVSVKADVSVITDDAMRYSEHSTKGITACSRRLDRLELELAEFLSTQAECLQTRAAVASRFSTVEVLAPRVAGFSLALMLGRLLLLCGIPSLNPLDLRPRKLSLKRRLRDSWFKLRAML